MSGKEGKQRHNENIHVKLLNSHIYFEKKKKRSGQTTTVLKMASQLGGFCESVPCLFFMD